MKARTKLGTLILVIAGILFACQASHYPAPLDRVPVHQQK